MSNEQTCVNCDKVIEEPLQHYDDDLGCWQCRTSERRLAELEDLTAIRARERGFVSTMQNTRKMIFRDDDPPTPEFQRELRMNYHKPPVQGSASDMARSYLRQGSAVDFLRLRKDFDIYKEMNVEHLRETHHAFILHDEVEFVPKDLSRKVQALFEEFKKNLPPGGLKIHTIEGLTWDEIAKQPLSPASQDKVEALMHAHKPIVMYDPSGPIQFTPHECEVMSLYHGGQGSMLYAASSSGALKRGTMRPQYRTENGTRDITNEEWMHELCGGLMSEADDAAEIAVEQGNDQDAEVLTRISLKAKAVFDALDKIIEGGK